MRKLVYTEILRVIRVVMFTPVTSYCVSQINNSIRYTVVANGKANMFGMARENTSRMVNINSLVVG